MAGLERVVVVGGSLAGLRAAEALRRRGFEGRLTVLGEEPHLPYDRPPLSKELLAGKWEPERTFLTSEEKLAPLEVDWRLGVRAAALEPGERAVVLEGGERVPFDGCVIATGAAPRALPGVAPMEGVHLLRTLDDALAIRAELERGPRVAVVGGGFIGAEVAATCRERGLEVTLLEALPTLLGGALDPETGEWLAALHREHGVEVRCGARVAGFEGGRRVERVRLAEGSAVPADVVVVGIGVAPRTDWLEGSGLELGDGVVCDVACRAAPGVVAAGDVARWWHPRLGRSLRVEHWTNATEQADAAAATLLAGEGEAEAFAPVPFFWSDQLGARIRFAGEAAKHDATRVVAGGPDEARFLRLYGREGRLTGALGVNRARLVAKARTLLREGCGFEDAPGALGVEAR